jgi:hypothetical protein
LCLILHQSIWTGTRSVKFTSRLRVLAGPKRRQLARQVGVQLRVGNTFSLRSRWIIFSSLFSPGRCFALGVSSSCPPTAATTWYSSPRSTTTTTAFGSPGGGELDDDISPWRKRNTRVCPTPLLAGGGGDGATMDRQEAVPRRLSNQSESTTPTPLRGTCRVLSSHLGQRWVSLPSNVPTPGGLMTPAPLRGTCWAFVSHLRQRHIPSPMQLHRRPPTRRYHQFSIMFPLDLALIHQATTLRLSHPVLEGKPNANHVRARISYSRTQQLHNMDIITQCSK